MRENKKIEAHIAGLYLAKFNEDALTELGCKTWDEVYIKIGHILGYKKRTIRNKRDYFDTFFNNERQGWHKEQPYKTVREVFAEYGNYDFRRFSEIVHKILNNDFLFSVYDPSFITNLSLNEKEHLQQAVTQEREQKDKYRNPEEKRHVLALWEQEGGTREVPIFDSETNYLVGIADLITNKEVIEVKYIKNWKHAVGQVFAYWYYLSFNSNTGNNNFIPRIHLFGGKGINDDKIHLCQSVMNNVFSDYIGSTVVTYAE